MSWDVLVLDFGGTPPNEFSEANKPAAMGSPAEVRSMIDESLEDADWSDPHWGVFEGAGFSLEFNMANKGAIEGFTVHVRGSGDAMKALLAFSTPNEWSLFDTSAGEFIDPESPSDEGWTRFQSYRDQVLAEQDGRDES